MRTRDELEAYYVEVYQDTRKSVECYIASMINDRVGVEDIAQEVYLEVYRKMEQLSQHPQPRGYLFRIARYKTLHWIRDRRRTEEAELLCEDEAFVSQREEQDEYEMLLTRLMLRTLLTEEEFDLFTAYYIEGYSAREIAVTQDKSHAAVRMSCSRMMQKLREQVKKQNYEL